MKEEMVSYWGDAWECEGRAGVKKRERERGRVLG